MWARRRRLLAAATAAVALVAPLALPGTAGAATSGDVTITFFWGNGCPHCAALSPYLDELAAQPGVDLAAYEVWYDATNRDLFRKVAAAHGIDPDGVPAVFVGGRAWIGDSPAYREAIASTVGACLEDGCPDVASAVIEGRPLPTAPDDEVTDDQTVISIPFFGSHDVGADSLVWATALIAFVDGFNPCSLWVLTVLLAMILRTGSRPRLALIGGTYVVTVAAVYGLFLTGMFGALTVVDYAWWIRVAVALFAGAFAIVNLKDFVWFGRGVSLTIPDRVKPRIVRDTRSLALEERRLPAVVALTVGLAAGVSLLELPCTVGFPVVWTNLLADRGVEGSEYAFLLAVYLVIFLLDELVILGGALVAMRIGRVDERHGRVLKLAGGVLMAILAVLMLVRPSVLETVSGTALVLALSAGITAAALLVDRAVRRRGGGEARKPPPARTRQAHSR